MAKYQPKHIPHAVYLDTNILWSKKGYLNINKPWMSELRSFTKNNSILLCISELVVKERGQHIFEELKIKRNNLSEAINFLKEYSVNISDLNMSSITLPEKEVLIAIIRKEFEGLGFTIVEDWDGPLTQLIEEAVQKEPPFEEGDRGFRDTIILESYIKHALAKFSDPRVVVISNDNAVRHSEKRFFRQGVEVRFAGDEDAIKILNSMLDEESATYQKEKQERLDKFVQSYDNDILEFVKKHPVEFTDWWLQFPLGLDENEKISGSIKSVLSAIPSRIERVLGGVSTSPENVQPGRYPISIWVEMTLDVIIEDYGSFGDYMTSRGIAEPAQISESTPLLLQSSPSIFAPSRLIERRKQIHRSVFVNATVSAEGVEKEKYSDFRLESVQ